MSGEVMQVELKHCPNPDIRPSRYWEGVPKENNITADVSSLKEASDVCLGWIDELGLGSGNWTGGKVFSNGRLAAQVSYNGKVTEVTNGIY